MKLDQLFFTFPETGKPVVVQELAPEYEVEFWIPRRFRLKPRGISILPFGIWGLLHYGRIFSNRCYQIILIRRGGVIVHRSCVFPRYFRFPFMAANDLQVGDTWTAPAERGKGLAKWALTRATTHCHAQGRTLWYICDETNDGSVTVAKKAGFELVARGTRKKAFGVNLLGHFEIIQLESLSLKS